MTSVVFAIVTAYCSCKLCCGAWAGGPTASGAYPEQGVTCATPRSVPFGAGLYIDGVGARVSQDRTARRYDGRFDVYFTRHADAKAFGKRRRRIIIVY